MRQKGAKRRLPAIARAVAWMVAVLALGSLDSRAQQKVDGILRIYVDQLRSASEKANGYGGTLDLRLQQPVSPVVSYLFSVRVAYDQRGVIFTVPPLTTYDGQVEPRFELRFNPKWFTSSIGGRWLRGRTRTTGSSWLDREEDNYYFRLDSALQNGFVGALEYDLRRIQFDAGAASTNDRLLVQAGTPDEGC